MKVERYIKRVKWLQYETHHLESIFFTRSAGKNSSLLIRTLSQFSNNSSLLTRTLSQFSDNSSIVLPDALISSTMVQKRRRSFTKAIACSAVNPDVLNPDIVCCDKMSLSCFNAFFNISPFNISPFSPLFFSIFMYSIV